MEAISAALAIPEENTLEENELSELQPPFFTLPGSNPLFSFLLEDTLPIKKEELIDIIQDNNTGIENKLKKADSHNDEEEQEEYAKDITYDAENSYIQKNPYAPKKDYERIEHIKPKEEEEEKSFLWK